MKLAVIGGDGIGPEVVDAALVVLDACEAKNRARPSISSVRAARCIGEARSKACFSSGVVILVRNGPGTIAFTKML